MRQYIVLLPILVLCFLAFDVIYITVQSKKRKLQSTQQKHRLRLGQNEWFFFFKKMLTFK